jgi:hypothetical protein
MPYTGLTAQHLIRDYVPGMQIYGAALAIAVLAGCGSAGAEPAPPSYAALLKTVAAGYTAWGRVDVEPRVAPTDCAAPPLPGPPTRVRESAATSGEHSQKVYFMWASHRTDYLHPGTELPRGMTIVKESFELAHAADGKLATGARKDLFVMTKVGGADAAGTDDGWIYGTVTPDGQVSSEGRVASCMGCHAHATHERLFGMKE